VLQKQERGDKYRNNQDGLQHMHVVYSRHTGFGGYFDPDLRLPGARVIEIGRLPESYARTNFFPTKFDCHFHRRDCFAWTVCEHIKAKVPDVKICRYVDTERFFLIVRSWILEAVLAKKNQTNQEDSSSSDPELDLEVRAKASEPGGRLMSTLLHKYSVVGVRRDEQPLKVATAENGLRLVKRTHEVGKQCVGSIDYRTTLLGVVLLIVWFVIMVLMVSGVYVCSGQSSW